MKPAMLLLGEVTSTMDVAKQCLALRGASSANGALAAVLSADQQAQLQSALALRQPFAVCAASQASGRGTAGRTWHSPVGNVFCTLVLPLQTAQPGSDAEAAPTLPPCLLPVLPLIVGLAAHQALRASFPALTEAAVTCKWPNDVLLGQKKAGGILIEGSEDAVLIGVGLNLVHAPTVQDGGRPSTSVADFLALDAAAVAAPSVVAAALVDRVLALLQQYGAAAVGGDEQRRRAVVSAFEAVTDMKSPVYRRLPTGERSDQLLQPLGFTEMGLLRVRDASGHEDVLVAEYLY